MKKESIREMSPLVVGSESHPLLQDTCARFSIGWGVRYALFMFAKSERSLSANIYML